MLVNCVPLGAFHPARALCVQHAQSVKFNQPKAPPNAWIAWLASIKMKPVRRRVKTVHRAQPTTPQGHQYVPLASPETLLLSPNKPNVWHAMWAGLLRLQEPVRVICVRREVLLMKRA